MVDRPRDKQDDDDHEIDPALKEDRKPAPGSQPTLISPTHQRRENESDANRDDDGQRKRAEEGL
jgi:hypothetical protein